MGEVDYMLKCLTQNGIWGTGGEMEVVEYIRDKRCSVVPRNGISHQKIQKDRYRIIRERGNVSGSDDVCNFNW